MTQVTVDRRSECYRLLGACFYPPDDALARTCLELAEVMHDLYPDTEAAAHAAALPPALAEVAALDVRVDHAALFLGPFGLKAAPYGSVYLEDAGTLMGDTTLGAAAYYAAAGLDVTVPEPADHIAVELEFMSYLAAAAVQAAERGDFGDGARLADRQGEFLHAHVGGWAPAFCTAVVRGAGTRFYRTLAECLRAFLEAEIRHSATVFVVRRGGYPTS